MSETLPWHAPQWERLLRLESEARMPHALLLRGMRGIGKQAFAERLAAALLCRERALFERPCDECRACRLVAAGTHPDLLFVTTLEDKRTIGIDQIRRLIDAISLTALHDGHKVVIVTPAEAMTHQGANTLLKTLEEPPGDSVFLLVAAQTHMLPATVRSRCQIVEFPPPPHALALPWVAERAAAQVDAVTLLRLAHGAPLAAVALAQGEALEARAVVFDDVRTLIEGGADPVAAAGRWSRFEIGSVADWLMSFATDLIRLRAGGEGVPVANEDLRRPLQAMTGALDLRRLFRVLDACRRARRAATTQLGLNELLLLEEIAIEWREAAG